MVRRTSFPRMGPLIVACLTMVWYFSRQPCKISNEGYSVEPSKTHVLILTSWRSGSSFVGQLFNQNPHIFYLIEPMWHVWASMPHEAFGHLHMPVRDLLRSIFSCDMSNFKPYMKRYKYITDLFMWHDSRALCSQPACSAYNRSDIIDRRTCFQKCGKIPFKELEDTCKTYSHVVVKSVRLLDLEVLYPLLNDPLLNIKIIHLVRDPRGVLLSRENFEGLNRDDGTITRTQNKAVDVFKVMQEICAAQVRIYKTSIQDPPSFLKDRYVMVLYEDLVMDPVGHIKDWYSYVGLQMSPKLESFIYNITHGETPKDRRFLPLTGDSVKIAQHWRQQLNFSKVVRLQGICKQEMELFGYRMVMSKTEQENRSLDIVLPLRRNHN
ncbi:carbohydrate sulfotransferase 5-like [Ambystoma mexicanum]|uniref:carbohydrate sulfotransferase 5-like n=1 Tax=Ambystoma mexicanum TaxID=8296 RepID=UPI0037E7497D